MKLEPLLQNKIHNPKYSYQQMNLQRITLPECRW